VSCTGTSSRTSPDRRNSSAGSVTVARRARTTDLRAAEASQIPVGTLRLELERLDERLNGDDQSKRRTTDQ